MLSLGWRFTFTVFFGPERNLVLWFVSVQRKADIGIEDVSFSVFPLVQVGYDLPDFVANRVV